MGVLFLCGGQLFEIIDGRCVTIRSKSSNAMSSGDFFLDILEGEENHIDQKHLVNTPQVDPLSGSSASLMRLGVMSDPACIVRETVEEPTVSATAVVHSASAKAAQPCELAYHIPPCCSSPRPANAWLLPPESLVLVSLQYRA